MKDNTKRWLRTVFVLANAFILLISYIIVAGLEFFFSYSGIIENKEWLSSWWFFPIVFGCVSSTLVGVAISFFAGRLVLRPIDILLDGMDDLSNGKYETRINLGVKNPMKSLTNSFNSLAADLERTEILREDFINNFSHEFKTPLASIKGLLILMKSGKVSREKQQEYFSIIEDELDRLSMMTTNVLNLTKIENQNIVFNKSKFNISEQIRSCVLLFEKHWREKKLSLSMDFDEYDVYGNEDLLKHVWINLIDNAIKFSDAGSELEIDIKTDNYGIYVSISNIGIEIAEDEREKIFNKFYQVGAIGSRVGNGIGLSVAKKIIELHKGNIKVKSENRITTFTIKLPII